MVAAWTALIYGTLPYANGWWRTLRALSPGAVDASAAILMSLCVVAAASAVWRRGHLTAARAAWGLGLVAVYAVALTNIQLTPAEKFHFLYYGLLAIAVYRALECDLDGAVLAGVAVLVTGLLGLGDEGIQYLLPRRHFEWKDVMLNSVSGALAVGVLLWWRDRL